MPLCLPPIAITEYAVFLTADSILARSTRRRQTSTGWNTAYIGANRYTLSPDEKPPADDALHPMAFLVEKGPGAVTRPHFHQADQFQVVVAKARFRRICVIAVRPGERLLVRVKRALGVGARHGPSCP